MSKVQFNTTQPQLAKIIGSHVGDGLQKAIEAELMCKARAIVLDAAKKLASEIKSRVEMYSEINGDIRIVLILNGEEFKDSQ